MKNRKRKHQAILKSFFLIVLALTALSITAFSFQAIYSNNVRVQSDHIYGIYQNGVFMGTDGIIVPSPYSVRMANISVQNLDNATRTISVYVDYKGSVAIAEPPASETPGTLTWVANFSPFEEKNFIVIGKDMEVSEPVVTVVGTQQAQPPSVDKKLVLDNLSNKTPSTGGPQTFGYVREQEISDLLQPVFAEQKKLDVVARSLIIIFAGFAALTLAGGFAFIFGKDEQRPQGAPRSAKIHIGDIYHNGEDQGEFSKYKYEESQYWK